MEKTVLQLFAELGSSRSAYKFSVVGGQVLLSVDGLMHSLRS